MGDWGNAGKGAAGGAAAGAAFGPYGAAVGGVAGGIYGYFSGGDDAPAQTGGQDNDRIRALINAGYGNGGGGAAAPGGGPAWAGNFGSAGANVSGMGGQDLTHLQAPQLQLGDNIFRQGQLTQQQQLQGIASGQRQGAGELAAQRQYANAIAAQQAQARMARGGNAALAYRNAANQSAALGSSAAGMGQQAALQDQMNAQGMLGQLNTSGRQGDFSVANANAGYQQGGQQLNSQNYLQLLNQLNTLNSGQSGLAATKAQSDRDRNDRLLGAGISAGGQILASQYGKGSGAPTQASGGNSGYTGDSSTWGA